MLNISGDLAIVGARRDDDNGSSSGSAYIFARDKGGANNWGEVAKLTPDDGAADDLFGSSVGIDGNIAVVGAYLDDDEGRNSGSAYIFRQDANNASEWDQVAKLTANDGTRDDYFGFKVGY